LIDLERKADVFVLHMRHGENRLNKRSLGALNAALDEVENASAPKALVTTGADKFYCNGIDLDPILEEGGEALLRETMDETDRFLRRLCGFPAPTVAAINGHAYAGGGLLALAHDLRVMRADRGFFGLPEIDLKVPFSPTMMRLIETRLSPAVTRDSVLFARRYTSADARSAGIVDELADEGSVVARAVNLAAGFADKDPETLRVMKQRLYWPA